MFDQILSPCTSNYATIPIAGQQKNIHMVMSPGHLSPPFIKGCDTPSLQLQIHHHSHLPPLRICSMRWRAATSGMVARMLSRIRMACEGWKRKRICHRENAGTLGWYPSCLRPPQRSPLLYKVYMGLIIKGTIPRVPPFSLWIWGDSHENKLQFFFSNPLWHYEVPLLRWMDDDTGMTQVIQGFQQ